MRTPTGTRRPIPVPPDVWAEHSVWPQDPEFSRALVNGGVTHAPDPAGIGQSVRRPFGDLKNVPGRTVQEMKFPGAPYGLKMACGENPKRVYGSKGTMPQTRMGNIALARETWMKAVAYKKQVGRLLRQGRRHARARCVDGYSEGRP